MIYKSVPFKFEVSISKNDEKHFEDKVDLCNKPKKSHNLSKIAMTAFSVPYICPVAFNYVSYLGY